MASELRIKCFLDDEGRAGRAARPHARSRRPAEAQSACAPASGTRAAGSTSERTPRAAVEVRGDACDIRASLLELFDDLSQQSGDYLVKVVVHRKLDSSAPGRALLLA